MIDTSEFNEYERAIAKEYIQVTKELLPIAESLEKPPIMRVAEIVNFLSLIGEPVDQTEITDYVHETIYLERVKATRLQQRLQELTQEIL